MAKNAIVIPDEYARLTFTEAAETKGEDIGSGRFIVCEPFDALYYSEDGKHIVWEKDFFTEGPASHIDAVFIEYLSIIMPSFYEVTDDGPRSTQITLSWAIPDVSTLGEQVQLLEETTVKLITGEVSIDDLHRDFYTPETRDRVDAMCSARPRIDPRVIAETILSGAPASMAQGQL